jgi:hypothetical protein
MADFWPMDLSVYWSINGRLLVDGLVEYLSICRFVDWLGGCKSYNGVIPNLKCYNENLIYSFPRY